MSVDRVCGESRVSARGKGENEGEGWKGCREEGWMSRASLDF